jgi:hypothetical protein
MRQSSKTKKGEPFQPMSFIADSMEGTLGGAVPLDYIPRRNTRSLLSQKKNCQPRAHQVVVGEEIFCIPRPLNACTLAANSKMEVRMVEEILPNDMVRKYANG